MAVTCTDHWESAAEPAGQEHQPGGALPGPALGFLPKVRKAEEQTALHQVSVCSSYSMRPSDWPT